MSVAGVVRRGGSGPLLTALLNRMVLAWNATSREWDPTTIQTILPGAPLYDVMQPPFNAVGDGIADDTAALTAAIVAANARPGEIYWGPAHRITAALPALANNNITIKGRGEFNGGTTLIVDINPLPSYVLTLGLSQYCSVQDVWFVSRQASASGFMLNLSTAFRPYIKNVQVSGYGNGIEVDRSVGAVIEDTQVNDVYGRYGIYVHGAGGDFCHDTYLDRCTIATSYLQNVTGAPAAWAPGTVYAAGNIVKANGSIWQSSVGGTSAGSGTGPSGLPSALSSTVHSTLVADNTVQWRFVMGAFSGFTHGSFAHTVTLMKCGVLQGDVGLEVVDDAPASGSVPTFNHSWQFSSDHPFSRGVKLTNGAALWFDQLLATSVQSGDGVEVAAGASAVEINSGQVFGCARNGVTYAGTGGLLLSNLEIGPVSSATANTFDGIAVANNAQNFRVTHCVSGDVTGFATSARYGISIGTGCDRFEVDHCNFIGNDTGPILCNVELTTTAVIRHNIPEWADYGAADGVEKFALNAGVQTLTLAATTHTAVITPTGAVVIDRIVHGGALVTLNSGVKLRVCKEGFASAGTVAFRDGNASLNAIWTPNAQDYMLSRFNDACDIQQLRTAQGNSIRWRVIERATPLATISVNVPVVAAGTLAYLDVSTSGTLLDGITIADAVVGNPTADLAAAGAGAGYFVGCRVSATNTIRCTFQGTLAGGAVNFRFTRVTFAGP